MFGLNIGRLGAVGVRSDLAAFIAGLFPNASTQGLWYESGLNLTQFQDSAGTTPGGFGLPVGLVLDKSKGLVLRPNKVINGDFSGGVLPWSSGANAVLSTNAQNQLVITGDKATSFPQALQYINNLIIGNSYELLFTMVSNSAGITIDAAEIYPKTGDGYYYPYVAGVYKLRFLANKVNHALRLIASSDSAAIGIFSNISIREIPGTHSTQPTATNRPILSARVNLFTKSEAVKASSSSTSSLVTDSATPIAGFLSAMQFPASQATTMVAYKSFPQVAGTPYVLSVFVQMDDGSAPVVTNSTQSGDFSMQLNNAAQIGVVSLVYGSVYRVSVARIGNSNNESGVVKYATQSPKGFRVAGYQIEIGTVLNRYQRIDAATDYDTAGWPARLDFDAVDDALTATFATAPGSNVTIGRSIPGVGAQILTGQTVGTTYTITESFAALVMVNRPLTAFETQQLTAYLNQRAGVKP